MEEVGAETKNEGQESSRDNENLSSHFFGATSNDLEPPKIDEYINNKGGVYKISEEEQVWEDRAIRFDEGKGIV